MTAPLRRDRRWTARSKLAATVSLALLLVACQANDPAAATPRDNAGVLEELARHGVTAVEQRSGDTGCGDASLVANAIHWRLRVGSDPTPRDVYLFRFKDRATFQQNAAVVEACRQAFEARSSRAGGVVDAVAISPWRAFGDGWSPELQDSLTAALTLAAGNGDGGAPPE
jgi:hypothetical protein